MDVVDGYDFLELEITQWNAIAVPNVSPTNTARIYYDGTSDTLKLSQNGAAYVDILTEGAADALYLKLDCSNDPLTAPLDVLGYVQSRLAGGQYARISHDGTYAVFQSNAGGILLSPGGVNDVVLRMGDAAGARKVYFWDNANAEVASIDSDGNYLSAAGNINLTAGDVTAIDITAGNSLYGAYLTSNFIGVLDLRGDPWYLSISLEVEGTGEFNGTGSNNAIVIKNGKRLVFDGA